MVLTDDNFATIVDAVREGRAIHRNIQKFIYSPLEQRGASRGGLRRLFVPTFRPLTPLMILWINFVTNGLPALALGVDPPDPTQMQEPPRKPSAGLLGKREYLGIIVVGAWMGATALTCYLRPWQGLWGTVDPADVTCDTGRAVAFSLLALSPLFHAFNCRSASASVGRLKPLLSVPLVIAVVLSGAIHLIVFVPALEPVFRTCALTTHQWIVLMVLSASIVPAVELLKLLQRIGAIGRTLGLYVVAPQADNLGLMRRGWVQRRSRRLAACGGSQPAPKATEPTNNAPAEPSIGETAVENGGLSSFAASSESGVGAASRGALEGSSLVDRESPVKIDGVLGEWPARSLGERRGQGIERQAFVCRRCSIR